MASRAAGTAKARSSTWRLRVPVRTIFASSRKAALFGSCPPPGPLVSPIGGAGAAVAPPYAPVEPEAGMAAPTFERIVPELPAQPATSKRTRRAPAAALWFERVRIIGRTSGWGTGRIATAPGGRQPAPTGSRRAILGAAPAPAYR